MSQEYIEMITGLIEKKIKYMPVRLGQVLKNDDPEKKGRVLCSIPAYNWTDEKTGIWCYTSEQNSFNVPVKDDYVFIFIEDGDRNKNGIIIGKSFRMQNITPSGYDGKATTKVLFESGNLKIIYDQENDIYSILLNNFEIKLDEKAKKAMVNTGNNYIDINEKSGEIVMENATNKKVELLSSKVQIIGAAGKFEVL
jgi:phage baseplate assembly protein gpV